MFERQFTEGMKLVNWFINKDVFVWEEKSVSNPNTQFFMLELFTDKKPKFVQINIQNFQDEGVEAAEKESWKKFDSFRFMQMCYTDGHIFFVRNSKIYFFEIKNRI